MSAQPCALTSALRCRRTCRVRAKRPSSKGQPVGILPCMESPVVMGVVNATPDSFSDGGLYLDPDAAVAHGRRLAGEGAAILDVGGESTRPGAAPVAEEEELERVVPVIERLADAEGTRISIDTAKAGVARAALRAGASLVNDVSAFRSSPE